VLTGPAGHLLGAALERAMRAGPARIGLAVVYHGIAARSGDPAHDVAPTHGRALVARQLALLRDRYRPVRASELPAAAAARRRGEPVPVAVTFDDDLPSHAGDALELLARAGLPATFFLNSIAATAGEPYWWMRVAALWEAGGSRQLTTLPGAASRSALDAVGMVLRLEPAERARVEAQLRGLAPEPPGARRLAEPEARRLVAAGHELGCHTAGHEPLLTLDDAQLAAALPAGRTALAALGAAPVRILAYPFGLTDGRVARAARAAGFDVAFTVERRAAGPSEDQMLLGRIVPSFTSVGELRLQLALTAARSAVGSRPRRAPATQAPAPRRG
jgi:peptidoglycan/xylan/chitin deacetylase (PgdA/CDA1 family)